MMETEDTRAVLSPSANYFNKLHRPYQIFLIHLLKNVLQSSCRFPLHTMTLFCNSFYSWWFYIKSVIRLANSSLKQGHSQTQIYRQQVKTSNCKTQNVPLSFHHAGLRLKAMIVVGKTFLDFTVNLRGNIPIKVCHNFGNSSYRFINSSSFIRNFCFLNVVTQMKILNTLANWYIQQSRTYQKKKKKGNTNSKQLVILLYT